MHSEKSLMLDFDVRQMALEQSDLFRGMPTSLIGYVATHAVERCLDDREMLFLKQDAVEFIALVVNGRIYSVIHGPDGREQIVGITNVGQVLGDSALFEDVLRDTSAFAGGPTRVLLLGRRHFATLCAEPAFLRQTLLLLKRRLTGVMELLEMVCLHRLESRLARFLLANVDESEQALTLLPSVPIPRNQGILAAMLNTSRPKLNVQLQHWRRQGLISGQRDRIVINNIDDLRRKASSIN